MPDTTTTRFTVEGMTCGHCVAAVHDELSQLPGVQSVQVDLDSGAVVVDSADPIDAVTIAAAVDEAGYRIAEAPR
jgi:copper ion binding protein